MNKREIMDLCRISENKKKSVFSGTLLCKWGATRLPSVEVFSFIKPIVYTQLVLEEGQPSV